MCFVTPSLEMKRKKANDDVLILFDWHIAQQSLFHSKSTLIRCLAGQHFHQHEQILVLGQPAFFSSTLQRNLTYLVGNFCRSRLTLSLTFDVGVRMAQQCARSHGRSRRSGFARRDGLH